MPQLKPNKTIKRNGPKLTVTNAFKPGKYRFRLQVKDDAGNLSDPAELTVTVVKQGGTRVNPRVNERILRGDLGRVDERRINTDILRGRGGRRRGG